MDKVIIDGVDVSGCVRLAIDNISCDLGGECKGWGNCYYKQLKRLEQENERLKDELRVAQMNRMTMFEKLDIVNEKDTYKQALQEIREIIDFRFKTAYMTFGYKEYDKLIEDIDKIVNEVIGAE